MNPVQSCIVAAVELSSGLLLTDGREGSRGIDSFGFMHRDMRIQGGCTDSSIAYDEADAASLSRRSAAELIQR